MEGENPVVVRLPTRVVPRPVARPKRRKRPEDDLWLVSYADLLTLLFCFFTLLLSVSRVDLSRMDGLKNQMDRRFGAEKAGPQGLEALQTQLEQVVVSAGLEKDVRLRRSEQGLVVDLNARILFPPGGAELSEEAMALLERLAAPLRPRAIDIQVEGHTDPVPIQNARFASNWELSSARASVVVRYLIDVVGYHPERLRAVGLSSTVPVDERGRPLAGPAPRGPWAPEYLARQRRVSLVLRPTDAAPSRGAL